MNFSLAYHWFFLAIGALLALWGTSLLAVRLWTRHQVIKELLEQEGDPDGVMITLPDSRAEDRAALAVIRSYRRHYLLKWLPGTAISFKAINEMSLELIKEIARAYYPDDDRPELKASLAGLVALHNRVGARLAAWLDTKPMRPFKDVELGTVVRYHEMYQTSRTIGAMPSSSAIIWTKRCGGAGLPLTMPIPGTGAATRSITAARRWRPGSSWPGLPTWWARRRCGSMAGVSRFRSSGKPGHRPGRNRLRRSPRVNLDGPARDSAWWCISGQPLRRNEPFVPLPLDGGGLGFRWVKLLCIASDLYPPTVQPQPPPHQGRGKKVLRPQHWSYKRNKMIVICLTTTGDGEP